MTWENYTTKNNILILYQYPHPSLLGEETMKHTNLSNIYFHWWLIHIEFTLDCQEQVWVLLG